jgi:hypothetical protein
LLVGSIDVEDVREAEIPKLSNRRDVMERIIPVVDFGFLQELESNLALSGSPKAV